MQTKLDTLANEILFKLLDKPLSFREQKLTASTDDTRTQDISFHILNQALTFRYEAL